VSGIFHGIGMGEGAECGHRKHHANIMARIPTFEDLLLEAHQGLGIQFDAKKKQRFADQEMRIDGHIHTARDLLQAIFDALELDQAACKDARDNFMEWANFHKAVELRAWTGNASQEQVLWHLLAYSYVPALARRIAFWSLNGVEHGQPFDSGMPGGRFWFLPHWDKEENRIDLPISQVLDWLLNLLGNPVLGQLSDGLGSRQLREHGNDAVVRTLHYWRNGTLPKSAEKIRQMFPDDAELEFGGVFLLDDSLPFAEQFQAALEFVAQKHLNADLLHDEIPMTTARLELALNGNAPEEEKREFLRLIALRYAKPEMRTIRQRIRVARMAQEGYRRLLKFLCPEVEESCADPSKNKVLQLVMLFEAIYNLTIQAWMNGESEAEENAWFESHFASWDKMDLLLSIMPSLPGDARFNLLAERLSRIFMRLSINQPLDDLVPWDEASAGQIIERRLRLIEQEREEDRRIEGLIERVRTASPWRALQAEDNYWAVSQLAMGDALSDSIREMACRRMRELATTPGQTVGAILVELGLLLNCEPKQRRKDAQERVQALLDEAEASPGYVEWQAPLLRLRAKHRLLQNDFDGAIADFKAALAACKERAFGTLRGEIAKEGWAAEISMNGFIPQNQEPYYRNMMHYMEFPKGAPSFEDAATECEEFFWQTLYQPYRGVERFEGPAVVQYKMLFKETFGIIDKADWDGLRTWLKRNAGTFRKNLKDARRNSVLLAWLKMIHGFELSLPMLHAMAAKFERHLDHWRQAIHILVDAWPEQAKIADFKGQTPLMLAADNGDVELTRMLVPLSDVDTQDYLGRTALHAAVTGGSPECIRIVVDRGLLASDKVSLGEGNTALHTAVRCGVPENVRLIAEEFPDLLGKANLLGQTPLEMAHEICEHYEEWRVVMVEMQRHIGSHDDIRMIMATLRGQ
jgi:hypothetical protein